MTKHNPTPMEFRYSCIPVEPYTTPNGIVGFYGVDEHGVEYGQRYNTVDEMITAFERVLASAKAFKENYARS
jgi:hypothetical protein